jgi:hypothetical protein
MMGTRIMEVETSDPEKVRIEFMPRHGDIVEFLSDRQTEKGPSSGTVIAIDRDIDLCRIRHSDTIETFKMSKVLVKRYNRHRSHPDQKPYWGLF